MTIDLHLCSVQKEIAYYLRNMGLIQVVGKKGNALLYAITHNDTGR